MLLYFVPGLLFAQRRERPAKPLLLVYGNDVEAFAAAMQGAKSSVPTVWITGNAPFVPSLTAKNINIDSDIHLDGGIWLDFLNQLSRESMQHDSVAIQRKKNLTARVAENELRNLASKQMNLTLVEGAEIQKLQLTKRGWTVTLDNRSRYDLRAVIDASAEQKLLSKAPFDRSAYTVTAPTKTHTLSKELSRTVVSIGVVEKEIYAFTLNDVLNEAQQNFFLINNLDFIKTNTDAIPFRMSYGQTIGAAAAYTAFFKRPLKATDSRKLQGELLAYRQRLVPYKNLGTDHPHFAAVQKNYLVGMFDNPDDTFHFSDSIRYDEVAPILNRLFSRSQLWFHEHKGEYFTLGDVLSLVQFIGMKGDEIRLNMENNWHSGLKFTDPFDADRKATREEFVVLLDVFANPFVVGVNGEGVISR